ncbi:unnamed protein product [Protopolystoma xenopodis]|uniref:Uncharacterized protein n=1 Tax=Protopolystoma xenopodis TaxID=117903 RepID=A0A448WQC5_9PLAT|nr:unnamed protein product [Protopolystoma xenopodis]
MGTISNRRGFRHCYVITAYQPCLFLCIYIPVLQTLSIQASSALHTGGGLSRGILQHNSRQPPPPLLIPLIASHHYPQQLQQKSVYPSPPAFSGSASISSSGSQVEPTQSGHQDSYHSGTRDCRSTCQRHIFIHPPSLSPNSLPVSSNCEDSLSSCMPSAAVMHSSTLQESSLTPLSLSSSHSKQFQQTISNQVNNQEGGDVLGSGLTSSDNGTSIVTEKLRPRIDPRQIAAPIYDLGSRAEALNQAAALIAARPAHLPRPEYSPVTPAPGLLFKTI